MRGIKYRMRENIKTKDEPYITKTMIIIILIMSLFAIGTGTYVEMYQGGVIDDETKEALLTMGRVGLWVIFPMSLFGYYIERNKKKVCKFIYNKKRNN